MKSTTKQRYAAPQLTSYGHVTKLTRGGISGAGDFGGMRGAASPLQQPGNNPPLIFPNQPLNTH